MNQFANVPALHLFQHWVLEVGEQLRLQDPLVFAPQLLLDLRVAFDELLVKTHTPMPSATLSPASSAVDASRGIDWKVAIAAIASTTQKSVTRVAGRVISVIGGVDAEKELVKNWALNPQASMS